MIIGSVQEKIVKVVLFHKISLETNENLMQQTARLKKQINKEYNPLDIFVNHLQYMYFFFFSLPFSSSLFLVSVSRANYQIIKKKEKKIQVKVGWFSKQQYQLTQLRI